MSTALPRIEAVAIVGSKNQKLYLRSRASYQQHPGDELRNELLRLEYTAHCALDVVEERGEDTSQVPTVVRGTNVAHIS